MVTPNDFPPHHHKTCPARKGVAGWATKGLTWLGAAGLVMAGRGSVWHGKAGRAGRGTAWLGAAWQGKAGRARQGAAWLGAAGLGRQG